MFLLCSIGTALASDVSKLSVAAHYYVISSVIWPIEIREFLVCVEKGHPNYDEFRESLGKRTINDKKIKVFPINDRDLVKLKECNSLILGNDRNINSELISKVEGQPILTISSESKITQYGGMVEIRKGEQMTGPKVNISNLEKGKLSLSAQLLSISNIER